MPGLDWATLRKLVEAAQQLPSCDRLDFLQIQCGDDADLLNEVLSLLKHEDQADTFLEPPAPMDVAPLFREHQAANYVGKTIGPFEITGLLGYGGMGVVLRARQANPPREVALKIVRGGSYIDKRQLQLFEREIRSLARLSHPAIASLYEAGCTEDGQHYFAMELVEGEAITSFARSRDLSANGRLVLFHQLCQAIHFAHQRGVIHRDLKPSNVLITYDGQVKVLDFGLAKITDSDLTATSIAVVGEKVEGTVAYMSPEQAHGAAAEIDVRSDVYSLGVILYELLTLRLPYDMGGHLPEIIRHIAEEPPIRPSAVMRALRGDLETIILMALEKEPQRRYQSAGALAEDVERFLNQEPIAARPASAAYQIRKLVARHKAISILVASIILLLSGSVVAMLFLNKQAQRQASIANNFSDILMTMLTTPAPIGEVNQGMTVREMLENFESKIVEQSFVDPESEGRVYRALSGIYGVLGDYAGFARHNARAISIRKKTHGEDREYVLLLVTRGWNHHNLGEFEEARAVFMDCLRICETKYSGDMALKGEILYSLADVETHMGNFESALNHGQQSLSLLRAAPNAPRYALSMALIILAEAEMKLGRNEEAMHYLTEACDISDATLGRSTLRFLAHRELGRVMVTLQQPDEALVELNDVLTFYQTELPPLNRDTGITHLYLAQAYHAGNQVNEAREHARTAIAILESHDAEADNLAKARMLLQQLQEGSELVHTKDNAPASSEGGKQ